MTIHEIENNGVIGAGGAGFPAHAKLKAKADTIIVNAAECEPLLHKDMELILHFGENIIKGLKAVINITGAGYGIIGIKEKHKRQIDLLKSIAAENIKVVPVDDVYPAGDEITLVYMVTGRIVKPGELPISAGCIVNNVETFYNIAINKPVIEKYLTVAGAVSEPATIRVPVGISMSEVLSKFKITAPEYIVRSGGLMMGAIEDDLSKPITKKTGGLIVLPRDHYCVTMYDRFRTLKATDLIAKAGCDQCSYCTELCPRYLLGYPVRPETAMRNRMFSSLEDEMIYNGNAFCCECNLCTMYSCPEGLDPKGATVMEKILARQKNDKNTVFSDIHPMFEYRKVPTTMLKQRLGINNFTDEAPLKEIEFDPEQVCIPVNQHIGTSSDVIVMPGDIVRKYDLIAKATGAVSSNLHASIDGVVSKITSTEIFIKRS